MSKALDALMAKHELTNSALARKLGCSTNYISGIRNGLVPSLKLASAICREFPGEITLADLGLDVEPLMVARADTAA